MPFLPTDNYCSLLTGNRGQPELVLRTTLWAAQMAGNNHPGAGLTEVLESGDGSANPGVVSDLAILHILVEV